jgi:hypothetical protein
MTDPDPGPDQPRREDETVSRRNFDEMIESQEARIAYRDRLLDAEIANRHHLTARLAELEAENVELARKADIQYRMNDALRADLAAARTAQESALDAAQQAAEALVDQGQVMEQMSAEMRRMDAENAELRRLCADQLAREGQEMEERVDGECQHQQWAETCRLCAGIRERQRFPSVAAVRRDPQYWIAGPGYEFASRADCPHGYRLTDSCPMCDTEAATPSPPVGRCGLQAPGLGPVTSGLPVCKLPSGHDGWHLADDGCEWGQAMPSQAERADTPAAGEVR